MPAAEELSSWTLDLRPRIIDGVTAPIVERVPSKVDGVVRASVAIRGRGRAW